MTDRPAAALPGPALASTGSPRSETVVFVATVPLLSLPVLLSTMAAGWALALTAALTAVVALLCLTRRVVVGDGWVAVRRLRRYRVVHAGTLSAVTMADTAHGPTLVLRGTDGARLRLRVHAWTPLLARASLASLVERSDIEVSSTVRAALGVATPVAASLPAPRSAREASDLPPAPAA